MTTADARNPTQDPQLNQLSLAYHRLARGWSGYRWWKPLAVGAIGATMYVVLLLALAWAAVMVVAIVGLVGGFDQSVSGLLRGLASPDMNDPLIRILAVPTTALLLPCFWIAALILGAKPVGLVSSIVGRLRWRWLGWCLSAVLLVSVMVQGIAVALAEIVPGINGTGRGTMDDGAAIVLLMTTAVLLVAVQAAAEEYVFRGFLMQAIGGWLRHPAFAILLPVPLLVIGRGHELLGMIDIAVFAVVAGWLTWRTGGLEAAIALHLMNNISLLALSTLGVVDANSDGLSVGQLFLSFGVTAASGLLILRLARTREIQRTRDVPTVPAFPQGII